MRELMVQVIALKRTLYKTKHNLDLEKLAIEESLLWGTPNDEPKLQAELLETEQKLRSTMTKLDRAQSFGLSLGKGSEPHCICCYVNDHAISRMVSITPRILGTSLCKCDRCDQELKFEP